MLHLQVFGAVARSQRNVQTCPWNGRGTTSHGQFVDSSALLPRFPQSLSVSSVVEGRPVVTRHQIWLFVNTSVRRPQFCCQGACGQQWPSGLWKVDPPVLHTPLNNDYASSLFPSLLCSCVCVRVWLHLMLVKFLIVSSPIFCLRAGRTWYIYVYTTRRCKKSGRMFWFITCTRIASNFLASTATNPSCDGYLLANCSPFPQRRRFRSSGVSTVWPKFHVEGVAPTNHSSCHKTRVNDLLVA